MTATATGAEASATLLSLDNVGLSYRARPALRGISWQWSKGEHWAILGPNGAGKTALATILAGEQQHYSGHCERGPALAGGSIAYVCFERGRRLCERDRKLDCSEFEGSALDVGTRVRDLLPPCDEPGDLQRVTELLGIAPILDRGLRALSTGEMRKALLAAALLEHPSLMILDSPLDGLDRAMQAQLGAALDTLIAQSHATLVLSRSVAEVPAACTHILLLDNGRVAASGTRNDVLESALCKRLLAAPTVQLRPPGDAASTGNGAADSRPLTTLALRDVHVRYGDLTVLRDVSWTLRRDQHCLISGPNGSGKSTLLDLLTGDNHKAYGQDIELFGRRRGSGESVWDIKARFGRVDARMQAAIPPTNKVEEVVLSGFFDSLGLYDAPSDRQRAAARAWLAALGIDNLAGERFGGLSFGTQRLVLLARAVVKEPAVLLLDEATLSLDEGHRRLMLAAIDHVIEHSCSQLLFVSHSAGERPACINQALTLHPGPEGSRAEVVDIDTGRNS